MAFSLERVRLKVILSLALAGELGKVFEERVVLIGLVWMALLGMASSGEERLNDTLEVSQGIDWAALTFCSLEVFIALGVSSLVRL